MIRLTLIIALLFLVGCTSSLDPQPTHKTIQMRHSAYLGKKIGLFILGVGVPYAKSVSAKKIVYKWSSRHFLPYPQLLRDVGEHWMDGECEVRLYTKPDGRIYAIYALESSAENWDIDACTKYLK